MLALALAALAGCAAGRQAQIRGALIDAGISAPMAECMARPLDRDLSVAQLRGLQRVASQARATGRRMTEGQVLDMLRRDLDPESVGVVARAGIGCLVRG